MNASLGGLLPEGSQTMLKKLWKWRRKVHDRDGRFATCWGSWLLLRDRKRECKIHRGSEEKPLKRWGFQEVHKLLKAYTCRKKPLTSGTYYHGCFMLENVRFWTAYVSHVLASMSDASEKENKRRQSSIESRCVEIGLALSRVGNSSPIFDGSGFGLLRHSSVLQIIISAELCFYRTLLRTFNYLF